MKKIIYLFSLTALFLTFSFVFLPVISGRQDENKVVSCDAGVCVLSHENNTSNDQAKEEKSSELKPHYAIAATAAPSHVVNDHSVEIVSVANFSEALAKIYNDTYKPEKTLIVFDIDNTITTSHNIHARCYSINPKKNGIK